MTLDTFFEDDLDDGDPTWDKERAKLRKKFPTLERALWRGWNEIHAAANARALLLEIHETGHGSIDSRKGVIFAALDDYMRMRLARILDSDMRKTCAGFDFVRRCWGDGVLRAAKKHGVDLVALDSFSERLKAARDSTMFHIDKRALKPRFDPWKSMRYREVDATLADLRAIYAELYRRLTGNRAPFFHLMGRMPSRQKQRTKRVRHGG